MNPTEHHTPPLCIALIGGIASGKSTVSRLCEAYGIQTLDADQVSRDLVAPQGPCYQALYAHFGPLFFNPDQTLNRAHLRAHIFQHPKERLWLENLLHPKIRETLKNQVFKSQHKICFISIPLLKHREDYPFCQRVLYVKSSRELQLQRLMQRDHMTQDQAVRILNTQPSEEEYHRLADDVIENNGNQEALEGQVQRLAQHYTTLVTSRAPNA